MQEAEGKRVSDGASTHTRARRDETTCRENTYQVGETVELLAEHTALSSPPRDLAVHEVEHEARDGEDKRGPEVLLVVGHEVFRGHEHGEGSANAICYCDEVCKSEIPGNIYTCRAKSAH